jgi:hypothetical protein
MLLHFQLPIVAQFVEAEAALLKQSPAKINRPGAAALTGPIGGCGNVGRAVAVVGWDTL